MTDPTPPTPRRRPSPILFVVMGLGALMVGLGLWQNARPRPEPVNRGFEAQQDATPGRIEGPAAASAPAAPETTVVKPTEALLAAAAASVGAAGAPTLAAAVKTGGENLPAALLRGLAAAQMSGELLCDPRPPVGAPGAFEARCVLRDGGSVDMEMNDDGDFTATFERSGGVRVHLDWDEDGLSVDTR